MIVPPDGEPGEEVTNAERRDERSPEIETMTINHEGGTK
jgi:hypothetical protein